MPHKCTACGRQFADGSKEMLSGCPDCGGTKFQFMPAGGAPAAEEPPEPPQREAGGVAETVGAATTKLRDFVGDDPPAPGQGDGEAPPTAGQGDDAHEDGAQSAARSEMVSRDELPGGSPSGGTASGVDGGADADRGAASSVEGESSTVGGDGGLENAPAYDDGSTRQGPAVRGNAGAVGDGEPEGRVVDTPSEDRPDLSELREELNDQFEGIRICEQGEYELNLMELYEREETIIALQENGRYVIEPPESWHGDG